MILNQFFLLILLLTIGCYSLNIIYTNKMPRGNEYIRKEDKTRKELKKKLHYLAEADIKQYNQLREEHPSLGEEFVPLEELTSEELDILDEDVFKSDGEAVPQEGDILKADGKSDGKLGEEAVPQEGDIEQYNQLKKEHPSLGEKFSTLEELNDEEGDILKADGKSDVKAVSEEKDIVSLIDPKFKDLINQHNWQINCKPNFIKEANKEAANDDVKAKIGQIIEYAILGNEPAQGEMKHLQHASKENFTTYEFKLKGNTRNKNLRIEFVLDTKNKILLFWSYYNKKQNSSDRYYKELAENIKKYLKLK